MDWYLLVWKKYADFTGRSRRKEYWIFSLIHSAVLMILLLGAVVSGKSAMAIWAVSALYWLAAFIPCLAVSVRRLHDIGKSGWWLLLGFVPFGGLVLLVFTFFDSEPGSNEFGPNPKNFTAPAMIA